MLKIILAAIAVTFAFGKNCRSQPAIETHGPCSSVIQGNEGNVSVTCSVAATAAPEVTQLLNRILSSQIDPKILLGKIDEMLGGVRRLNEATPETVLQIEEATRRCRDGLSKAREQASTLSMITGSDTTLISLDWFALIRARNPTLAETLESKYKSTQADLFKNVVAFNMAASQNKRHAKALIPSIYQQWNSTCEAISDIDRGFKPPP